MPKRQRSFVKELQAAAPGVLDFLAQAEALANLPLSDVEFKSGDAALRVLVTLSTFDVSATLMVEAMHAIAQLVHTEIVIPRGPYRSIAQPSGYQLAAHACCEIDGIRIDIQGLFDAEQYAAATRQFEGATA